MKVAVWYNNRDLRLEEVSVPRPSHREMLVKVHACGICGSDVVEWYRLPRAPLVPGHEVGAEVVEVGSEVTRFRPGDRVFVAPKVPCGQCRYCRLGHFPQCAGIKERLPGGLAEFVLVPGVLVEKGAYRLPASILYDQSTFIEPLACVVRAQRIAGLGPGQSLLVLGCGMSGLLNILLAKERGHRVVATDVIPKKLEYAKSFGADLVIPAAEDVPARLEDFLGSKADVVMVCASAMSAVNQAWASVDRGGAVVFFAVPGPEERVTIPVNAFWTQEIRVLTSYYCGPPDILEAMDLLSQGLRVDRMITHRLPLSDIVRGFQLVMNGQEAIKVIIQPHASSAETVRAGEAVNG